MQTGDSTGRVRFGEGSAALVRTGEGSAGRVRIGEGSAALVKCGVGGGTAGGGGRIKVGSTRFGPEEGDSPRFSTNMNFSFIFSPGVFLGLAAFGGGATGWAFGDSGGALAGSCLTLGGGGVGSVSVERAGT